MPRQKLEAEGKTGGGQCRVRKRGCSSSSSSSLARKCRFKRAILLAKKGGASTPVPPWRMGSRQPSKVENVANFLKHAPPQGGSGTGRDVSMLLPVSARKLAAALWEMQDVPSTRLSNPSYTPLSETMDQPKTEAQEKRRSPPSQNLELKNYHYRARSTEIETPSRGETTSGCTSRVKNRLKEVSHGLTASKELVKVLYRIWRSEEQYSSTMPLVSALRIELDRARSQIDRLIQDHRSSQNEIACIVKQFSEDKSSWKRKEQVRISEAVATVTQQLEVEKKLRRQTERLNLKLGKELAETKVALSEAVKELKCERRAREVLEEVYDEIARGIGEDRAQAEELKKESARVREEVEKEREMLQLADVLREERVQMKLLEAKYQFEEKNAAVDKLKNELEAFLRTKVGKENGNGSPHFSSTKEFQEFIGKMSMVHPFASENAKRDDNEGEVAGDREELEGDDSGDDADLHSIELNVDNSSRSYKWSYASEGSTQDGPKTVAVENDYEGRKSLEKIQWGNISFGRQTSASQEWETRPKVQEEPDGFSTKRLRDLISQSGKKDCAEESKLVKTLQCSEGFSSPSMQWGQSLPSQEPGTPAAQEGSIAGLQWSVLSARLSEIKGECR